MPRCTNTTENSHDRAPAILSGPDPAPALLLVEARLHHPATLRRGDGRGHVPSRDHTTGPGAKTVGGRLCAALTPSNRWSLRREPEPAAALLPVPGHHEAQSGGYPGTGAGELSGDWP